MGGILLSPEMFKAYFIVPKANPQYPFNGSNLFNCHSLFVFNFKQKFLSDQTVRLIFSKPFYF